jgi:hypothetical protein
VASGNIYAQQVSLKIRMLSEERKKKGSHMVNLQMKKSQVSWRSLKIRKIPWESPSTFDTGDVEVCKFVTSR